MTRRLTRRGLLSTGAAAGAAGLIGAGISGRGDGAADLARASVPEPAGRPSAQHAWNRVLRADRHDNPTAPRHHRLLFFALAREPDRRSAAHLEDVLRTLEHRHADGPDGMLAVVGYGPAYFTAAELESPIPAPSALTFDEVPELDDFAMVIHLAGDDERQLERIQDAVAAGKRLPGADGPVDLRGLLSLEDVRTGFAGTGLPAAAQRAGEIEADRRLPDSAPLLMGHKSGLRGNQATEADVTIADGPWAGGTTMHVSRIVTDVRDWWAQDADTRAARMYAPQRTAADVARFTSDAPPPDESVEETARRHGRVGHAHAAAAVRRDGRPIILRRDFNTVDDDQPGVHFVSLHRTIADFMETRSAMDATAATHAAPQVTSQLNNGINEWIRVTRRGNYLVPSRARRAFPRPSQT